MYGRIPYLNISLIFWAIQWSDLRRLLYYIRVCSGTPPSALLQVPWWLPVDLPNISANTDHFEAWLLSIERSFQGLSVTIETMRIVEELVEIWPNEVCDILPLLSCMLLLPIFSALLTLPLFRLDSQNVFFLSALRAGPLSQHVF